MANSYSQSYGSLSVSYNGPVEVGNPTQMTFKYTTPSSWDDSRIHYYEIHYWYVTAPDIDGNDVRGYVQDYGSIDWYENWIAGSGLPETQTLNFLFGGSNNIYENDRVAIHANVTVIFYDANYHYLTERDISLDENVPVNRIQPPAISGTTVLLDCSNDEFKLSAIAGAANRFDWSIIPGSGNANIIAGNGSDTVTIKPGHTGEFDVKVVARRTQASQNYHKETTIHISRKARTIDYRVLSVTTNNGYTYIPDYICKGTGRDVTIPEDNNYTNIVWNAPNCTVNYLGHLHGKNFMK